MAKKTEAEQMRSDIADLAKKFGRSKVKRAEHIEKLRKVGFADEDLTNNALVVASVFANAVKGDMNAVCKWQELTGEPLLPETEKDEIEELMDGRKRDGKPGAVRKNRAKVQRE